MKDVDMKKELGKIVSVRSGLQDRDIITCWVDIEFDGGGGQSYGGLCLDEDLLISFERELCDTFNVSRIQDLVGLKCFALRNFDTWNEYIVGLLSEDTGRKFTSNNFRKKYCGTYCKSPILTNLENRKQELHNKIERAAQTIRETSIELRDLESKYIDWDD